MKNKIKRTTFFILLIISISIISIFSFVFYTNKTKVSEIPLSAAAITDVKNHIKISAQPVSINSQGHLLFKILFETFQEPDFLDIDVLKICFLEDEEQNPIAPLSWQETDRTQYKKKGLIIFPFPSDQKKISLKIFELEERTFEWKFNNINKKPSKKK
ncbi:hypothetical protein ACFLZV_04565 [Candidatus Margulisiibacteriota bacterium]